MAENEEYLVNPYDENEIDNSNAFGMSLGACLRDAVPCLGGDAPIPPCCVMEDAVRCPCPEDSGPEPWPGYYIKVLSNDGSSILYSVCYDGGYPQSPILVGGYYYYEPFVYDGQEYPRGIYYESGSHVLIFDLSEYSGLSDLAGSLVPDIEDGTSFALGNGSVIIKPVPLADVFVYVVPKQPTGYSITYHANGGTPTPTDLIWQTKLPNPLPTVSKSGYRFDGWYTDSSFTTPAVAGAAISADTDLYAKFTAVYSITYHSNGGTPTPTDLTGQTNLPNPLPAISKSGHRFDGWFTNSTFTTPAVAGAEISADTDLYAKFTAVYSITYHANGGIPTPTDLTEQTALPSTLPTVSKANFSFDGWYYDNEFQNEAHGGDTLSTNVDLYAKFTRTYIALDLSTIGLPAGTHSIQTKLSDNWITKADSELSNAVQYIQYVQLQAPTISINGDILSWSAVPNASSYSLYVNNVNKGTVTSGMDLTTLQLEIGSHNIQVMAIGSGYYTDSVLSNTTQYIQYAQLQAPTISINGDILSWSAVPNASSYKVYADNTDKGTATSGINLTNLQLAVGTHTIQVMAIGSGYYTDSVLSNTVSYTVVTYMPIKGQIINLNLDGTSRQYRVLTTSATQSQAEVVAMFNANEDCKFNSSSGTNTYSGGDLDVYLNTTWYSGLTDTAKNAIVSKTLNQYQYSYNASVYKSATHASYADYSTKSVKASGLSRKVYALDIEDIENYFNHTFSTADLWELFWDVRSKPTEDINPWFRSANPVNSTSKIAWLVIRSGYINGSVVNYRHTARPAFTIDLSKISWS